MTLRRILGLLSKGEKANALRGSWGLDRAARRGPPFVSQQPCTQSSRDFAASFVWQDSGWLGCATRGGFQGCPDAPRFGVRRRPSPKKRLGKNPHCPREGGWGPRQKAGVFVSSECCFAPSRDGCLFSCSFGVQ